MIRYLKHTEVDKQRWDFCIDHCTNPLIYAYSWYLDIVSPNWNALVEDDYTAMMPLTGNKKYGITYLYPPYFAQQLGLFSKEMTSQKKVVEFLSAIPSQYKFIEINLNTHNTFEIPGFQIKHNANLELSLGDSYEALRKKYQDDTKRNIKKAFKHKITLQQKGVQPEEVINLFRKNTGKKIHNLTNKNYKVLLRLINTCIQKGYAEVHGVFSGSTLCAGAVWLIKNNRAFFLFSATDNYAKKSGAMFLLVDNFIREHAGQKMILDFEGSNLPGLARFYKGFGSDEHTYLLIRKNKLTGIARWIKAIKKTMPF